MHYTRLEDAVGTTNNYIENQLVTKNALQTTLENAYQPKGNYVTQDAFTEANNTANVNLENLSRDVRSNYVTNATLQQYDSRIFDTYQPKGAYLTADALQNYVTNETLNTRMTSVSEAISNTVPNIINNVSTRITNAIAANNTGLMTTLDDRAITCDSTGLCTIPSGRNLCFTTRDPLTNRPIPERKICLSDLILMQQRSRAALRFIGAGVLTGTFVDLVVSSVAMGSISLGADLAASKFTDSRMTNNINKTIRIFYTPSNIVGIALEESWTVPTSFGSSYSLANLRAFITPSASNNSPIQLAESVQNITQNKLVFSNLPLSSINSQQETIAFSYGYDAQGRWNSDAATVSVRIFRN
jgi:hypothetical protein